ncbi:peptide deformylase [Motilimonas eburnea]|nr:peptide deformylase [Motilimonas eburnea]MCE2571108.1 peptide deformylase [Motilimonas eburnea]
MVLSDQAGCLSVPEHYADVEHFSSVVVSALDRQRQQMTIESDR